VEGFDSVVLDETLDAFPEAFKDRDGTDVVF